MVRYESPVVASTYAMLTREDPRQVRARVELRSGEKTAARELDFSPELQHAMSDVFLDGAVLQVIMEKLQSDVASRHAASEVCVDWCKVDGRFRREVTIANCYSCYPHRLVERFPRLVVIKLKCKPRSCEFQQLVPDWGGYAREWIEAIAGQYKKLESLHLKRAVVTDQDLECLAKGCGATLRVLILNKCDGFTAKGLLSLARGCGSLRVLNMSGSHMTDLRGEWLKVLAVRNPLLTDLELPDPGPDPERDEADEGEEIDNGPQVDYLETLVTTCLSLRRLTLGPWIKQAELTNVLAHLARAPEIRELGTGIFEDGVVPNNVPALPDSLTTLTGLYDMGDLHLPIVSRLATTLKRLDLKYSKFSTDVELDLIKLCVNLEVLEVRPTVGDVGMRIIGQTCRHLIKLRVERLDVDHDQDNDVTGDGLTAVARGCPKLEFLVVYAAMLDDESLIAVSQYCAKLNDLRLIIVQRHDQVELPSVDNGVMHIMQKCEKLTKLALAMRTGCLTNAGLRHIAEFGGARLKWLCLVCAGDDDNGLKSLLCDCPSLRRLELRGCQFTASGFRVAFPLDEETNRRRQLKYLWMEGAPAVAAGPVLRQLCRGRLHIEVSKPMTDIDIPEALFAYFSFRRVRSDCDNTLIRQLTDRSCEKLYSGRRFSDE